MNNSITFDYLSLSSSSSAPSSSEEWEGLLLINWIVYRGYFLFLIVAGTCGNFLTAITLLREKLRRYTTCQFMAACALLNIGVLLTNTMNMMLTQGYHIHLRSLFGFSWCRINAFVAQWIRGMASWIIVMVAFDRFQQSKTIRRTPKTNNRIVILTLFITGFILLIFNLHYLLFTGHKVVLENTTFLACMFDKHSNDTIQKFFGTTSTWQELVTYIIVPCILTLILNIFIIKNSFLKPMNNEHLKSRSKSRTRRVTTMLLASNIGFLALVGPAQIFYALAFDPQRDVQSNDGYKSFIVKGNIYQCLINTYYAASFVFCFASSSIFRREIKKLLIHHYQPKHSITTGTSEIYSPHENRSFLQQTRLSVVYCPSNENVSERAYNKRPTESTVESDGLL